MVNLCIGILGGYGIAAVLWLTANTIGIPTGVWALVTVLCAFGYGCGLARIAIDG